ncbi:MAG: hypothetical protein E6R03_05480 [Hyphomicrobiaceae bacterium]|nr:MAG: hypothetical protein E6R03_05480 [Hyphomicrobiaceae bacterium]
MKIHRALDTFERKTYLRPNKACKVIGIAYSTYMGYREMVREMPDYVILHIDTLLRLPPSVLREVVEERVG